MRADCQVIQIESPDIYKDVVKDVETRYDIPDNET